VQYGTLPARSFQVKLDKSRVQLGVNSIGIQPVGQLSCTFAQWEPNATPEE
jgi:hypothetical protein